MDDERWEALVRRLEPQARANPRSYRRRVVLLAAAGYAFIGGLLLLLLALAALVVYGVTRGETPLLLKLLLPIAVLVWIVARSLFVKFEPPSGIRLHRAHEPELFRMINEVRGKIRGPRVHDVLVDDDANARVAQVPRLLGMLGSRNYLVLGLPFFFALSADELRAVVAHELGHLSRAHGRFGAFVYHVRATWVRLLAGFAENDSMWTGLIRRFFVWYVPYFEAYTLPVARAQEFEADDAAAEAAGRETAASALVASTLVAHWLHESYWPRVYRGMLKEAAPPQLAFTEMVAGIGEARRALGVQTWYRATLDVETDVTASHPSIGERLAHLGLDPPEVLGLATRAASRSAADAYLGDTLESLVAAATDGWRAAVAQEWARRHAKAQIERKELERLDKIETPTAEIALRRANLTRVFGTPEAALVRYRELLDTENDAAGRFGVGQLLLERGDEEGLRWLDEAIERDPEVALAACEVAHGFLLEHGREKEAADYVTTALRYSEALEASAKERAAVSVDDRLEAPEIPDEWREDLRRKLAWSDRLARAYLVRKRTEHFDQTRPLYVLALVPRAVSHADLKQAFAGEAIEHRVARQVELPPPADLMVVKVPADSPLAKHVAGIPGSLLG